MPRTGETSFKHNTLDGIGVSNRKNDQYSIAILEWVAAFGSFPSAGGARAPIADILPRVGTEVKRHLATPDVATPQLNFPDFPYFPFWL